MELKDNEVALFALIVPTDEIWDMWMPSPKAKGLLRALGAVGISPVSPDGKGQAILFRTAEQRTKAYKKIHKVFPKTLTAYATEMAIVDKKYLGEDHEVNLC